MEPLGGGAKDHNRVALWDTLERKGILRASGEWGIGETDAKCPPWVFKFHLRDKVLQLRVDSSGKARYLFHARGEIAPRQYLK